ncbi:MAG TPA: amidohydrolase family protein [Bryobacteraceae bacterium]|nr:amidohydrolase family protein [Bryobacteraceae bacterium]
MNGIEAGFDEIIQSTGPAAPGDELCLAPGWIDIQVNGFAGVDFNDPGVPLERIAYAIGVLLSTGVTRFYPTVITGPPDAMIGALRNLAQAAASLPEGGAIDGFHVEGPHISAGDDPRGAHPLRWVRPPDLEEFRRWQEATEGRIRIVTISPEWPEAPRYIERIVSEGVVASIGHTAASEQQIADAVSAGATLSTHLGNGGPRTMPRHPNYLWQQLAEDRLMADFIVDGIHLPGSFVKTAIRAKGVQRSVLVTDAAAPAGAAPGRYRLGEQTVDLTPDQRVVLAGEDRLAGSALRMDRAIENVMRLAGVTLAEAIAMATVNAARAGNVPGRLQGLAPGDRADFVQFRYTPEIPRIEVVSTWIDGRRVYPPGSSN